MSTTRASIQQAVTATEILDQSETPAAASDQGRTLQYGAFNVSSSLTDQTTPAIEAPPAAARIELDNSGATTLDLTAMPLARDASKTHDYTGKRVVAAILKAGAANAGAITIAPGASDPYPLFGAGNEVDLAPGMALQISFVGVGSGAPAVASGAKTIDISGTEGDALDVFFLLGT